MRKTLKLTMLFIACVTVNLVKAQDGESAIFKGTADAKYNGQKLIIYNHAINLHDSVTVVDGKFELRVPFKEPGRYMFYSDYERKKKGGYTPYGILVTKSGTVDLNADMETLANSAVKNDPENEL